MRSHHLILILSCLATTLVCADTPCSVSPKGRVNYPANFQVAGGIDLLVFGDYLYWKAQEDDLYYVQSGGNSEGFIGSLERLDPDYGNGLRVGLGLNFPKEGIDLIGSWLWFKTEKESSCEGALTPLWAEPDFSSLALASSAKGKWHLDLNVGDLEWGRSSWFGGNVSLRPFLGLRAALINQNLTSLFWYKTTPTVLGKLEARSDFKGGGLRAGADGRFTFPHDFSLYATTSLSLLYGQFNAGAKTREDQILIARTSDLFWQPTSALQMALGLAWDTHFANDRCHIEFHVGCEENLWFGLGEMNRYVGQLRKGLHVQERGTFGLLGLVAGGRFDF